MSGDEISNARDSWPFSLGLSNLFSVRMNKDQIGVLTTETQGFKELPCLAESASSVGLVSITSSSLIYKRHHFNMQCQHKSSRQSPWLLLLPRLLLVLLLLLFRLQTSSKASILFDSMSKCMWVLHPNLKPASFVRSFYRDLAVVYIRRYEEVFSVELCEYSVPGRGALGICSWFALGWDGGGKRRQRSNSKCQPSV